MFIHTFACAHTDIPQWLYSEALALVKGHLVGHRCRLKYESLLFVLLQKCMRERFVWVWWSQTGNTMHLFKSQQPKMHPAGKWACLHLEVWALLYSLRLPQPPGSCSPASGLRLPRPLGSGSPGLRAWQELLAALLLFLVIVQDLVNFNGQG